MPNDTERYRNSEPHATGATDGDVGRDEYPMPQFRDRLAALGEGDVLQFRPGDLAAVAREIGRSSTHVLRTIRSEPDRGGSEALRADFTRVVGVPPERCRLLRDAPKAQRPDDADAA
jgi:hypothetical protein